MFLFQKGQQIANYTVSFPHKEGSYAETYRVKDASGKTKFLKLISYARLRCEQLNDQAQVVEVEISKMLHHHNLCNYVDSGQMMLEGQQFAYIVTDFVSGETLAQKVARDGNLSVYETKQVAMALLNALSYLHSLEVPVIHNEVTIQNTMLNLVGGLSDLKLIDFGHARFLNQPPAKPTLEELNLFYLAPERFNGTCCVQSDLYAVGVLMYHCLFGELPWFVDVSRVDKKDRVDYVLAQRDKELEIPDRTLFELDEQLINTMCKAMSYDVADRFQSADEFINAIDGEVKIEKQSTKRKVLSDNEQEKDSKRKATNVAKGPGFAAIAGMEDLKEQMRRDIIRILNDKEKAMKYKITIPNGMLLYGPPRCGKTFFAKHFAEEVGFNFMLVTPATLRSRYINATQENISEMFKEAEENAPTIIFIDEADDLLKDRNRAEDKGMSGINEFLAQMDRTGERGIFVIGATNKPELIDVAILGAGRLERHYYVGPPDLKAREEIFRISLKDRPYDFGIDYEELAKMTENYVSADIAVIVENATRIAYDNDSKITMDLLKSAITSKRPSLSKQEIAKYEAIRAQMEGESQKQDRPHIGFR